MRPFFSIPQQSVRFFKISLRRLQNNTAISKNFQTQRNFQTIVSVEISAQILTLAHEMPRNLTDIDREHKFESPKDGPLSCALS